MWLKIKKLEKWFFYNWAILAGIYAISFCVVTYVLVTDQESNIEIIRIASGRKTDDSYKVAKIIADHINSKDTYLRIQVLETLGSNSNVELLLNDQVDVALVHYHPNLVGSVNSIAMLYDDAVQIITRKDVLLKNFGDLVGKKVALATDKSIEPRVFELMLDHFNLTTEDINTNETSWHGAKWSLENGFIDAIFRVKFANNEEVTQLISRNDANLFGINQPRAIEFKYPYFKRLDIPAGTYKGNPPIPNSTLETVGLERFLVASNSLSSSVVSDITEMLFEDRQFLMLKSNIFDFMKEPSANSLIPMHQGASAYFNREKPSLLQENAELLALILTLLAIIGSVYVNAKNSMKRKRVLDYNKSLLALKLKIENAKDLLQLSQFKEELDGFIGRVVEDAVSSKISNEGFEFFSFTWENVKSIMNEKEKGFRKYEDKI